MRDAAAPRNILRRDASLLLIVPSAEPRRRNCDEPVGLVNLFCERLLVRKANG